MDAKPVGMMDFDGKVHWYGELPLIGAELFLAATPAKQPPEGILHHAMRDQMERDAAEGLRAIEEQQRKRERRLAEEQRREDERRGPRSGDMHQVASVMQPHRKEFLG